MEVFRVPTDAELFKLSERRSLCEYFFSGIFIVRKDSLRKLLTNNLDRTQAERLINERIDNYYTCMTDNKLGDIAEAPELVQGDIKAVKHEVISELTPKSLVQHRFDGIFRKLVYSGLI